MKTLLVAVNSKYIHSSLSVWYLKAVCPQAAVFECTINQKVDEVYAQIIEESPDVLGFSCYIYNIAFVDKLLRMLADSAPHIKVILGGPEVSFNPEAYSTRAHHVITGEGEQAFKALVSQLEHGEMPPKIIHGTPQEEVMSPYTDEYFAALHSRIAYFESSRGCPFSCAFCLSGRGDRVRLFDLEDSKVKLVKLANSGTKTVKFVDRTFNCNAQRAYDMWDFVINSPLLPKEVCFHFEIGADLLQTRHIELLATAPAGKIQLEIGLQSFNVATLGAVQRKTDMELLTKNIKSLVALGNMHIHTDLIIGLPYEGMESFKSSFNTTFSLGGNMLQVGFLKMLHGSALRAQAEKYSTEYESTPPYTVTKTGWLNESEIVKLKNLEDVVERMKNSGRFEGTLKYIFEETGQTPFDVFFGFSLHVGQMAEVSHDDYTAHVYDYFGAITDKKTLRDKLTLDRMETNRSGQLPECLKIYDAALKTAKKCAEQYLPQQPAVKRATQILYTTHEIAFVDYTTPHPITGAYKAKIIKFNEEK